MAVHLARLGKECVLWARRSAHAEEMRKEGENTSYLKGFPFPPSLSVTAKVEEAVRGASFVVIAVPTQSLRTFLPNLVPHLPEKATVVSASKGIEEETLLRVSEVLREQLPITAHKSITHLSGPSFAKEVAAAHPTTVCAASLDSQTAKRVQQHFHSHASVSTPPTTRLESNSGVRSRMSLRLQWDARTDSRSGLTLALDCSRGDSQRFPALLCIWVAIR